MKGIVLAGGSGTRLSPLTTAFSKQLLPVYDKPMVVYPIATLMAAGIREIAIISTAADKPLFEKLLGTGSRFGITFEYFVQDQPRGIPEAFLITEKFIAGHSVGLILGDNIFHGSGLGRDLAKHSDVKGAKIFGYRVANPCEYGVIELDAQGEIVSIEEKPKTPKSNYAIPGLYFFDSRITEISRTLRPSARGELEIVDVLNAYRVNCELSVSVLPRGTAWLDTGTPETLLDASNFVRVIQSRQGIQIASLEEIAWRRGWISTEEMIKSSLSGTHSYSNYLLSLANEEHQ
jgi:glucose-1-phosphate thymidylyltransferase